MTDNSGLLILTTISVAFLHTVLGPDHYVPFIAMAKAAGWDKIKTIRITLLSGLGHVFSTVILAAAGILLGEAIIDFEYLESIRGNIAGWMLISFGLIYFIWGLKKALAKREHIHLHKHDTGEIHIHQHSHKPGHIHLHTSQGVTKLTPWVIFTIFVLGPCEPLIPIIIYPAVSHDILLTVWVILIFSVITMGTMLLIVLTGIKGLSLISFNRAERYSHALAGMVVLLCGAAIQFLAL